MLDNIFAVVSGERILRLFHTRGVAELWRNRNSHSFAEGAVIVEYCPINAEKPPA